MRNKHKVLFSGLVLVRSQLKRFSGSSRPGADPPDIKVANQIAEI